MIWHPIPGFPRYEMTRDGQVRSVSRREGGKFSPRILRPRNPSGSRSYYVLSRHFQLEHRTLEALWELTFGEEKKIA